MFGISWGGFNSLQIAALAPEPLKAVVTVCSTDDRYDNDVHYMGGSVLAVDMHAWAATMLAFVSRPPDPVYAGEVWHDLWVKRLETVDPFLHTWLAHQTRDDLLAPRQRVRGLLGDPGGGARGRRLARPVPGHGPAPGGTPPGGPRTGDRRALVAPVPRPGAAARPGDRLPPGDAALVGPLAQGHGDRDHVRAAPALVRQRLAPARHGVPDAAGPLGRRPGLALSPGGPGDVRPPGRARGGAAPRSTPGWTRAASSPSATTRTCRPTSGTRTRSRRASTSRSPEEIWVLGRPRVRLRLTTEATRGQVVARLCDVAPDGSSTLVTRGVLNLSARHGRDQVVPWKPGSTEDVVLDLNAIGHAFPPGHRDPSRRLLRVLAVDLAPAGFGGGLHPRPLRGARWNSRSAHRSRTRPISFEEPEQAEPHGGQLPRDTGRAAPRASRRPRCRQGRVAPGGGPALRRHPGVSRRPRIHRGGAGDVHDQSSRTRCRPAPARTGSSGCTGRTCRWDARVETHSETTCDEADFITSNEVICKDGDEVVFHRTWEKRIPRTAG